MKTSGRFDFADYLIGPAVVLYYFVYSGYVGSGRSDADAKIWTPGGIALLYLWVAILLIKPIGLVWSGLCSLVPTNQCRSGDEVGFLVGICLILLLQAFLRKKHAAILEAMAGVPVPARGWVVAIGVLFCAPLLAAAVGLGKAHTWMATAVSFAWYFAWSAFLVSRSRRSDLSR